MNYSAKMIPQLPLHVVNDLITQIDSMMQRVGMYYRVFGRVKSSESICKKLNKKHYVEENRKMQDIVGLRIAVYFDDVNLVVDMLKKTFDFVDSTIDKVKSDQFSASRTNLIFRIPNEVMPEASFQRLFNNLPIDNTFELQIRTILSEGWHEVEHDLKYKQPDSWIGHDDYARALNSILAPLTNCDWTIRILFENLAHEYYRENNWLGMCRNHLRIRFADPEADEAFVAKALELNHELAKFMLKVNRRKLISVFFDDFDGFPCTLKNLVCVCAACVDNIAITIPTLLQEQIEKKRSSVESLKEA